MAPDRGVSKSRSKQKMLDARSNPPTKRKKKIRQVSIGKQIRDLERMLKRELPQDNKKALEKRVKELKEQREADSRLKIDRKLAARYKQVKFIERRKVERRIRRAEIELRNALDAESRCEAADKLDQLKEDLEYVRFFPKAEKYVSLFMKNDDQQAIARREKLREVIRANIAAAAAAGVELEESGSEEDYPVEMSDDDFFVNDDGTEPESSEEAPENNNLTKLNGGTSAKSPTGIGSLGQTQKQMDEAEDKSKRKRKRKRPKKK